MWCVFPFPPPELTRRRGLRVKAIRRDGSKCVEKSTNKQRQIMTCHTAWRRRELHHSAAANWSRFWFKKKRAKNNNKRHYDSVWGVCVGKLVKTFRDARCRPVAGSLKQRKRNNDVTEKKPSNSYWKINQSSLTEQRILRPIIANWLIN